MMTTDNAELYIWPIDMEDGDVTVCSGGIIQTISGGYKIADKRLLIRPARELFMPLGTARIEPDVLEAVYTVVVGAPTIEGTALRVKTAIEWLNKAATSHHPESSWLKTSRGLKILNQDLRPLNPLGHHEMNSMRV